MDKVYIIKEIKANRSDYSYKTINILDNKDVYEFDGDLNAYINDLIVRYDDDREELINIEFIKWLQQIILRNNL